jgi:hypothetical protein
MVQRDALRHVPLFSSARWHQHGRAEARPSELGGCLPAEIRTRENLSFQPVYVCYSDPVKRHAALIILGLLACSGGLEAFELFGADSTLRKTGTFALGGVGVAGTMSEGERALREILKRSDAATRLENMLPQASAAGQLYALLGLRARDRDTYQRALAKYSQRKSSVRTMRGCSLQDEAFGALIKQIDHGDYDSFLARSWPGP